MSSARPWIAERLRPVEEEVVIIEHILTLLGFDIGREQRLQLGCPGGAPRESRAQDFFDREFGIDALSRKSELSAAFRYMRARWTALVRCFDDGRLALDNNPAERALRCVATRRSLCPSSSSIWKHWKLVCRHDATRTTCSPNRGGHPFLMQVVGTDLVGSARHNLLGREDAAFDKAADAVERNSEPRGGLTHREPFAVLLGRTVSMNAVHPAHRADTVRSPGFSLTGGHSHPVQRRGDVLVRPSGCHGPHHREGLVGGAAAMLARLRFADPQS